MKLHGEVISWSVPNKTRVRYADLKAALTGAGLNEKVAKDMNARNAFIRACCTMQEQRIIRLLEDTAEELRFQFTKESATTVSTGTGDEKRLAYNYEAVLTLDKKAGTVTCKDDPTLATDAEARLKAEAEYRGNADLNRITQKLFDENADLFRVRDQGGCYFVPAKFSDFCEKVENFLAACGGSLKRFPVPAGYSAAADRSVKEAVDEGIEAVIEEHLDAIKAFDGKTRENTLKAMAERINVTRFKVEAYESFLADKSTELNARLAEARQALRVKIAALGKSVEVKEPASGTAVETTDASLVA